MDSKIAGPVTFYSLRNNEPRICVIEDGEKTFYYSDGRFKPNGSIVLDIKGYPKVDYINSHIDKEGNPINLPTKLDEPVVLTFLTDYDFIEESSTGCPINFDWIKTKDALWNMCRYYNLFSLNDNGGASRYVISFELNSSNDYLERREKPYIFSIVCCNSSTPSRVNHLPFRFINKKATQVFIENFQSYLIDVIKGWRKLLSKSSSMINKA